MAERGVLFQKRDERRLSIEAKGIVGEVDRMEVLERKECSEEGRKCRWDLREEARGEDIG